LDEPTSAIDVVAQDHILNLLNELKELMQLTYIIISHDLAVVNKMADRILIMYLGKIVETGPSWMIFSQPLHPYTVALFNAIPDIDTRSVDELVMLKGDVPSAIHPPEGCRFHPRCERAMPICKTQEPKTVYTRDRYVACHLYTGGNAGEAEQGSAPAVGF
ncbi:MAG: peptide ABC transporter substrate-binding protein, partial [Clostridiales Family XIII bacterium]|nr:peptide ABC transporter substrate-binding protein [Clostridiales Family XIII bacterium]